MEMNKDILEHLRGGSFTSSFKFRYERGSKNDVCTRFLYIRDRILGKRVIHLGCVDHTVKKAMEKREENMWMHDYITQHASRCLGVDIAEEAVREVSREMDVDNIIAGDITGPPLEAITQSAWEYMVLAEVLEHIDNPVSFLQAIRENYRDRIKRVIITVPNALYYRNFKYAAKHVEDINSDHRYWFTPYTLAKVLHQAGYHILDISLCQDRKLKLFPIIPYIIRKRYPLLRSKIVAEASL